TVLEDGRWTYDPSALPADATAVSFNYQASDGSALSNVAIVTINFTNENHAPVAKDETAHTDEDTVVSGALLATDAENDTLTYALAAPVAGVSVAPNGTWSYDPRGRHDALAPGQSDTVSFAFTASDGNAVSNTASITITITGVNDAPVA